jgi:hypothetical protein
MTPGRMISEHPPLRRRGIGWRPVDRLILDTGVLVALERGRQITVDFLPDDADWVVHF